MTSDAHDRARLADWLADHDEACPVCRYNLRGTTEPVCPECGAALRLSVASPTAGVGAWSLAVVALAMGLGFDAVVLLLGSAAATVAAVAGAPARSGLIELVSFLAPLVALGAGSGLGLFQMFRHRRAWMLMTRRRQWRTAIAIFVGVGVVHALGGALMVAIVNA